MSLLTERENSNNDIFNIYYKVTLIENKLEEGKK